MNWFISPTPTGKSLRTLFLLLAMGCISIFSLLSVLSVPVVAAPAPVPVINGDVVEKDEQWPWMVSLTQNSPGQTSPRDPNRGTPVALHACGGTLISPTRVLTAAHCVLEYKPADLDAVIGREDLNSSDDGERIEVMGMSMHPDALPTVTRTDFGDPYENMANDVAILKLARPARAQPIKLANPRSWMQSVPGRSAQFIGYGLTDNSDPNGPPILSNVLRKGRLQIISDDACVTGLGEWSSMFLSSSMICAQDMPSPGRNAMCSGDSGGPLLVGDSRNGYREVGVVSWSGLYETFCSTKHPSVFAHVANLLPFITEPDSEFVPKPYNRSKIEIVGKLSVGETVRCMPLLGWANRPTTLNYEWLTTGEGFKRGENSSTYKIQPVDEGTQISCVAKVRGAGGSHVAKSEMSAVVTQPLGQGS